MIKLKLGIFLVFACTFFLSFAQETVSVVDENALTINGKYGQAINGRAYQKDMLITHNGWQYITYYNADRRVCISRRKLPTGNWQTIEFLDYFFEGNDAHNVISMGICKNDGTIHLAFDHHVHPLHYKVSIKGLANAPESHEWSEASFSPILGEMEKGKPIKITYPKFWSTPDGNLQFNYRVRGSGNGDRYLVDYDATSGTWKNTRQIDSSLGFFKDELGASDSRCSYPNGYDYDKNGILHTTWVWREGSNTANHDLMYAYSEDKGVTWKNYLGQTLTEVINVNSPGIVVQKIPRVLGLMNDHGQVIDSKGQVHVIMYHCTEKSLKDAKSYPGQFRWGPQEAKRYHHYWGDKFGVWHHTELNFKVGNRPKILVDKNDNLYVIYVGDPSAKHDDIGVKENLVVAYASAKSNWTDWQIKAVVKGAFLNDALADFERWKTEGILSVLLQDKPVSRRQPSELKVVDLHFK